MTIIEAINRIDNLKPNDYSQSEKIRWLSVVDNLIYNDIIKTHVNKETQPVVERKVQIIVTSGEEGLDYRLSPDLSQDEMAALANTSDVVTEANVFPGYTDDTPLDTPLIAEAPYDELYLSWLESKIDYYNGEYSKYNNAIMKFNEEYAAYSRYYNRTHMPLKTDIRYF